MSGTRSILIIANPVSGRGKHWRKADQVAILLKEKGVEASVTFTSHRGHAETLTMQVCSETSPPDCVAVCGGDGTIQEVAHALASHRSSSGETCPALGLIPSGRCNDFARALDISTDPLANAIILANGNARAIDLGKVNGRHFCTVATVGIDAEISSYVDRMRIPLTGTLAYLYGAMQVLRRYRPRKLKISGDFGTFDHPVFLASSANTSSYGGAIPIAPEADCTDGQLDLCVINYMSKLQALKLIPQVMKGRHIGRPDVYFVRTKRVEVEADQPLELWADGERIAHTPAIIESAPEAIRVIIP